MKLTLELHIEIDPFRQEEVINSLGLTLEDWAVGNMHVVGQPRMYFASGSVQREADARSANLAAVLGQTPQEAPESPATAVVGSSLAKAVSAVSDGLRAVSGLIASLEGRKAGDVVTRGDLAALTNVGTPELTERDGQREREAVDLRFQSLENDVTNIVRWLDGNAEGWRYGGTVGSRNAHYLDGTE